jgi:hypothetical protein
VIAVRGVALALFVVGWAATKWCSGADWRHNYRGRRRVTRPVRAVGQSLVAVVGGCAIWRPLATVATLGAAGVVLAVTALVSRTRCARPGAGAPFVPEGPYRTRAYVVRPRAKIAKRDDVKYSDLGRPRQEVTR